MAAPHKHLRQLQTENLFGCNMFENESLTKTVCLSVEIETKPSIYLICTGSGHMCCVFNTVQLL